MRIHARLASWLRGLFLRSQGEREMTAEIQQHIENRAEDLMRGGLAREEALRRARIEFGGVENFKEECRVARGLSLVDSLLQDLRFAFRMLRKSPGFTAVAVLTLALGIGANTAIFSVVYAVLLKPLPFPHPGQLISLFEAKPQEGIPLAFTSYDNFTEIRGQNHVFSELAGLTTHDLTFTGHGEPADLATAGVTPELFAVLGTKPLLGRAFLPEDGKQGAAPVVILSETVWRDRFAADAHVIGTSTLLDNRPYTIVGIVPADASIPFSPRRIQFWIPVTQDPLFGPWTLRPGLRLLGVVGRLKPGISIHQAQAEMDTVAARLARKFPAENSGWAIRLTPLQRALVGNVRTALLVLLGAVALVLLIACANIANLLLARATSRAREVSLRQALGASRRRILRQLFTESVILGSLGAVAGILLAFWGVQTLTSFLPPDLPTLNAVRVDGWVLAFALALSFGASIVFGLAPAILTAGADVQTNLKEGASRSGTTGGRRRARSLLAASEIALAVVLVIAAGLLVRSFISLTSVDPGFNPQHLLKAEIDLPQFQYSTPQQWIAFSDTLLDRVHAQPGLQNAALAVPLPLANGNVNLNFSVEGAPPRPRGTPQTADYVSVSPEYFHVMDIPLLRGRLFSRDDVASTPRVTIINETLAQMYFPNESPLGKRLIFSFPPAAGVPREIVGVVGDVRDVSLHKAPGPMMYVPNDQAPFWGANVVARTTLVPSTAFREIRAVVQGIDKNLPVTGTISMPNAIASSVAQPRIRAWLLGLFGIVALMLATIGIFGVISYSVSCRTQEFGLRIALGASRGAIGRIVLRESLLLAAVGLSAGMVAALTLAQFLKSQLYGVGATDPLTFAGTAALLLGVALAAGYLPARRATRVDPMVALRYE